jgi:hypothetical protein
VELAAPYLVGGSSCSFSFSLELDLADFHNRAAIDLRQYDDLFNSETTRHHPSGSISRFLFCGRRPLQYIHVQGEWMTISLQVGGLPLNPPRSKLVYESNGGQ